MLEAVKFIIFDPSYATFWTALGSCAQGIAAIMAAAALLYSITTFGSSLRTSHYTELDRMYFELLKLSISKPHFLEPSKIQDELQAHEYSTYAFMLWNFLETIYDRCQSDKVLWETWQPILTEEAMNHREWFMRPMNRGKFKDRFFNYVSREIIKAQNNER